jgi:hypothetical protein
MSGTVDSAGKAGNDDEIMLTKIMRQAAREAARGRRGVASAHDAHRHAIEQVQLAFCNQQGGRIVELGQRARIQALPQDQRRALGPRLHRALPARVPRKARLRQSRSGRSAVYR